MPESWQRHDLLRVEPQGWSRVLRLQPRLAAVPYVTRWAAQGWPLIVRRRSREDAAQMIPVGMPLPPVCGKLRIAAQVAAADAIERLPPQTLRAVRGEVPLSWQLTVDAVLEVAGQIGVEPRVFGSLLWQGLTGLPYLSATSDLDLLWPVTNPECATRLVNQLAAIEEDLLIRLDGELLLPAGGGVQWREWYQSTSEVLVKTMHGVQLRSMVTLFQKSLLATGTRAQDAQDTAGATT